MKRAFFTNWEWLTLIGIILSAGVGVTVFAMSTFEASGAAKEVKQELRADISRVEKKVDALLLNRGLNPKIYERDE